MASLNKVILIGNLGGDPDVRYTASGEAVANISIATTDSWKDKNSGKKREITEWHRVVFYRKLAEIVGQYLKKGSAVYVEGRIRTKKWQDKEGQERYTTQIEASDMRMLGIAKNPDERQQAQNSSNATPNSFEGFEDDIPF